jgi:hypothetical protein
MSLKLKIALVAPLRFISSPDWLDSLPKLSPRNKLFSLNLLFSAAQFDSRYLPPAREEEVKTFPQKSKEV